MNKSDKIQGQVQLENTDYYQPLDQPMVVKTANKVAALIQELYDGKSIDGKTLEWLQQTRNHRAYQNFTHSQTNNCRTADYFGMRRPDRKNFSICGQTSTAYCSIAEIVHQRYHRLHQFYRKQKVPNKHIASDNGRYKPTHKYTASRGYTNCKLSIRRILSTQPSNPNCVYQTNVKAHSTRKLVQVYKQTFSAALRDRDGN